LRVGEAEFDSGAGSTALLLVHGINFSPIAYRNFGPALAQRGFKCRAMRLPGFAQHVQDYAGFKYPEWIAAVDREVQT
jgi:esterase/lipase